MPRHRVMGARLLRTARRAPSSYGAPVLAMLLLAAGCGESDSTQGTTTTTTSSAGGSGGMTTSSGGGGAGGQTSTGGGGATTGGGGAGGATSSGGTGGQSLCGNGAIDPGESCEGDNLQDETCVTLGFPGGALGCSQTCQFDLAECTGSDNCYDGVDNDGDGKTDCEEADCTAICNDACFPPLQTTDPDDPPGSTAGHANVLTPSCAADSGPEVVYSFTSVQTGALDVTVIETGDTAFTVSVRTACDDGASEIACSSTYAAGAAGQKSLSTPITEGQTVFVVVDSVGASAEGPFALVVRSRLLYCGDGIQDPPEACDDGNGSGGDGCDAGCAVETTETEPNGSIATANTFSTPWYASIDPAGDTDFVQIAWPTAAGMAVSTAGIGDGKCTDGSMDTILRLFDGNGTLLATSDDHAGSCSFATIPFAPAGTYYAQVLAPAGADAASATFPYTLSVSAFQCGNGALQVGEECDDGNTAPSDGCDAACKVEVSESEPNDTTASADAWSAPWIARIDPDNDQDVVMVTVPGPGSKITATTTDPTGGAGCSGPIDTYLEILKQGDQVLASNDDANGGYCSVVSADNLPAGTYFVRVKAPPLLDAANVYIYSYKLNIKVE